MRKKFLLVAALAGYQLAHAGGFLTNTNQSISFLRNPARDAAIGIDGAYINPAGIGFMPKGWHFSFNLQNVHQKRLIKSYAKMNDIELFAQKTDNAGNGWKDFNARAKAPVFPTLDLARVYDRAFFSLHMGVTGGGGKATFSNGTGMFEKKKKNCDPEPVLGEEVQYTWIRVEFDFWLYCFTQEALVSSAVKWR